MKLLHQIGTIMLLGMKLQVYFLLKTLMGGIVLGIFPAFFGSFRIITKCITERDVEHMYLLKELKQFNKKEFIKTNLLGYIFLIWTYILMVNIWVSQYFFEVRIFNWFTIGFLILTASIALYVVALFTKYELPIKQYILQGFLCSIIGILETVAIVLGIGIATGLAIAVPLIGFSMGIPLLILPHALFSRVVITRLERVFYKMVGQEEQK